MTTIYNNIEDIDFQELEDFYKMISLDEVKYMAKGEGIKVAVLDSGVDFMHPMLTGRVYGAYNAVRGDEEFCLDNVGHGTYISGLICARKFGMNMNVRHYSVKVTDDCGGFSAASIIRGIRWCIKNKIDIICMAFGSKIYHPELHSIIKDAFHKNIIMIASAGNNGETIEYPAKFDEVLCVGSIDYSLERASFSATGEEIDIVLPSVNIPSLYSYGRYAISSGSSPAAAIATGIVVAIQSLRVRQSGVKFNLYQLQAWFKKNTIDLGVIGFDNEYGLGVPTLTVFKEKDYNIEAF